MCQEFGMLFSMTKNDKTVLEQRKEIIGILKYFPLNEKKWIMKRFWDHIEKASSFEDETKINRKLPPKLINDQKGQIMYMAFNLLLDNHIDALLKEKYPSVKIN